ncbi:MAG: MFS transporter [Anaerolineales bacterium]|nr:MFS transporter [Anaerolineales bacterium]
MKSLSFFRLLAITAFSFALTLVSNTLEPAVLGHKVLELVPDRRNTALGFTTFAGLIVAILVQPIVGVFSDRTRSRLGRRLPYLIAGTLMVIACLYLIALAPAFGLVVLGIMLIQVASNTVQGPWQALIPDLVPEAQRGRASGLKAMLDILAFVVGRQVAGQLVGRYPQWGETAILIAVTVPVVVYLIGLAVTAVWARESPEAAAQAPQRSVREAIASTFSVDFRAHPAFGWWFANRMLFWAAFIALSTFLLFFMIDVVGMAEAEAQKYVGTLSTLLGAALVIVTLPSGWLADRVGRKPVVITSGVVAALGAGIILIARQVNLITVGGVIVGLGVGLFMSANWALVTDIVPRPEAARYLGIANIATAGGSAVARFLGGALIDPLNRLTDSTSTGYFTVYAIAAGFFLLSALVVIPLPSASGTKKPMDTPTG